MQQCKFICQVCNVSEPLSGLQTILPAALTWHLWYSTFQPVITINIYTGQLMWIAPGITNTDSTEVHMFELIHGETLLVTVAEGTFFFLPQQVFGLILTLPVQYHSFSANTWYLIYTNNFVASHCGLFLIFFSQNYLIFQNRILLIHYYRIHKAAFNIIAVMTLYRRQRRGPKLST